MEEAAGPSAPPKEPADDEAGTLDEAETIDDLNIARSYILDDAVDAPPSDLSEADDGDYLLDEDDSVDSEGLASINPGIRA